MNTKLKASHLLVETEKEAADLKKMIEEGEDFADAAARASLCPSGANGGDLGFFGKGQMVKEFEDVCFNMNVGDISAPVKTQFGWHLIKLTDKED